MTASVAPLDAESLVQALKAAGEPTRLRLLALLARSELNVSDLTGILGQSQPRISRHLKILLEAGLVERFQEGAWVLFRRADGNAPARILAAAIEQLDPSDDMLARDLARLEAVKRERARKAEAYFKANATRWDSIRSRHVAESKVEAAMLEAMGPGPFDLLVDLGTGTGRMLELFADRFRRGIGIDASHAMLALARVNLERAGHSHCQVRHGDIYHLPLADGAADAIVIHQVLHFLDEPAHALGEAARVLAPGGRLLVVDFAPHGLEFLREEHQHRRLGFTDEQVAAWLTDAGLSVAPVRRLAPDSGGSDALTVSLWLAHRPGSHTGQQRQQRRTPLEHTI